MKEKILSVPLDYEQTVRIMLFGLPANQHSNLD